MTMVMSQAVLETRLFFRRKDTMFWTFIFPVFFMGLFGLIYGGSNWPGMGIRSVDYLLPGIVVMGVMVTGIMYTAVAFVTEREKGIYRRLALTPLSRQSLIGGQSAHNYGIIIVQTLLLVAIGIIGFNIQITGNVPLACLVLMVGAVCFMSIGFALTGLVKTARSATPITQIPYFFFMFLGGIFYPNSMLPKFLGYVANVLPSTHMNDALRLVFYEGAGIGDIWQHLLVLVGWTVACFIISIKFFRWE